MPSNSAKLSEKSRNTLAISGRLTQLRDINTFSIFQPQEKKCLLDMYIVYV